MIDPLATAEALTQLGLLILASASALSTPYMIAQRRSTDARLAYCCLTVLMNLAVVLLTLVNL